MLTVYDKESQLREFTDQPKTLLESVGVWKNDECNFIMGIQPKYFEITMDLLSFDMKSLSVGLHIKRYYILKTKEYKLVTAFRINYAGYGGNQSKEQELSKENIPEDALLVEETYIDCQLQGGNPGRSYAVQNIQFSDGTKAWLSINFSTYMIDETDGYLTVSVRSTDPSITNTGNCKFNFMTIIRNQNEQISNIIESLDSVEQLKGSVRNTFISR